MERFLQLDPLPRYVACAFRAFDEGERHVTRYCAENVLLLMQNGLLRFREDGKNVELGAGEWYIQQAGLFQEGWKPSDCPRYFYIHFHGCIGEAVRDTLPLRGRFEEMPLHPLLVRLDSAEKQRLAHTLEKNSLFLQVLNALRRSSEGESTAVEERVACRLAENFPESLPLRELAAQCGYAEDSLIRRFRRRFHLTPHQYVQLLRVSHAKELLTGTDYTQERIAAQCGFSDDAAFYRAFIKSTGMSPGRWRAAQRGILEQHRTKHA